MSSPGCGTNTSRSIERGVCVCGVASTCGVAATCGGAGVRGRTETLAGTTWYGMVWYGGLRHRSAERFYIIIRKGTLLRYLCHRPHCTKIGSLTEKRRRTCYVVAHNGIEVQYLTKPGVATYSLLLIPILLMALRSVSKLSLDQIKFSFFCHYSWTIKQQHFM